MRPFLALLRRLLILAPAALVPGAPGHAGDFPFESGLRWTYEAEASGPWIPSSVRFSARDGLVWASGNYGTPHLALLSASSAPEDGPLFLDHAVANAFPILAVEAGREPGALFALAQYPAPDAWHRRTEICARGLVGGGLGVRWTHDMGWLVNGSASFAVDERGDLVVAAVRDAAAGAIRIDWLRGADGAIVARQELSAGSLERVAVSPDGSRVVVAGGLDLWIFDEGGTVLHHETLTGAARAIAMSVDGTRVLVGQSAQMRILAEADGAYTTVQVVPGFAAEIAVCVAIAEDASTYAVAWWDAATGVDIRLAVRDGGTHQLVHEVIQNGVQGGLQNIPAGLAISPDGRRIAFGAWGDGGPEPELWLLDRAEPVPLLELDLPGSVQDLDLDASGTRVVVALKHTHANHVGSTGEVRLYETGERDLQLVGQPRIGGSLDLAFQNPDAQDTAVFMLGFRGAEPVAVPGALGSLLLDRAERLWVHYRPVDAQGRADLHLSVPAEPSLFGLSLSAQVAWRRSDGVLVLSDALVDPTIL